MAINAAGLNQLALLYGPSTAIQGQTAGAVGESAMAAQQVGSLNRSLTTAADAAESSTSSIDSTPTYSVQSRVEANRPGQPGVGQLFDRQA